MPIDINNDTLATNNSSDVIVNNHVTLRVRTTPQAVASLSARITTIVGVLMWKFYNNQTGGYPITRFTADYRIKPDENETNPNVTRWIRMDPSHIPPNAVSFFIIVGI